MPLAPRDADSEPVDVLAVLKEWSQREDAPRVVRESCVVAIDMWEVCTHLGEHALVLVTLISHYSSTKIRTSSSMPTVLMTLHS